MTHLKNGDEDSRPQQRGLGAHRGPPHSAPGFPQRCELLLEPASLLQSLPDGHMPGMRMDRGVSMPNMLEPKASAAVPFPLVRGRPAGTGPGKDSVVLSFHPSQTEEASWALGRHVRRAVSGRALPRCGFGLTEPAGLSPDGARCHVLPGKHQRVSEDFGRSLGSAPSTAGHTWC